MANQIARRHDGQVWHALSPDVIRVKNKEHMIIAENLFGNFFITSNLDIAMDIANDRRIRANAIDLLGNSAQSDGMMAGGYFSKSNSAFIQYMKSRKFDNYRREIKEEEAKLRTEMNNIQNKMQEIKENQSQLRDLKQKLRSLEESFRQTDDREREKNIQRIESDIAYNQSLLNKCDDEIERMEKELEENKESIRQMGDSGSEDDKALMEEKIKNHTSLIKKYEKQAEDIQREYCKIEANVTNFNTNEKNIIKKIKEKKENLEKIESNIEMLNQEKNKVTHQVEILNEEFDNLSDKISKLEAEEAQIHSELQNIETQLKEQEEIMTELNRNKQNSRDIIKRYEDELLGYGRNLTIEQKEELSTMNPKDLKYNLRDTISKLEEVKEKLKDLFPKLNRDADNKNELLKDKMVNLNRFKSELTKNKDLLNLDIRFMDGVSSTSYNKCFESVNENLGQMFSKLLPGASAKMEEVETKNGMGVEIKVAFNGQWKESLTELSGGQKSLLALSFMLSMLKYKSAPFYILDEIDAAMDLSHTENIGDLISSYFPESQFIVISLKKGMYSNARVLYKTRLVEGKSHVDRIDQYSRKHVATGRMVQESMG